VTFPGPEYLFTGSRLTDDTYVLRLMLEGLNTWARQWSEKITIQDDGSLEGLGFEVEQFKYLRHRPVTDWESPNIVVAFMDRLSMNRAAERSLRQAETFGRAAFIVSSYRGGEVIPQ
jgi:hypothetical protein